MGDFVYLSLFFVVIIVPLIDSFTLDSVVNIPSFVMVMTMVFSLTYGGDFCKGLIVLVTTMY